MCNVLRLEYSTSAYLNKVKLTLFTWAVKIIPSVEQTKAEAAHLELIVHSELVRKGPTVGKKSQCNLAPDW